MHALCLIVYTQPMHVIFVRSCVRKVVDAQNRSLGVRPGLAYHCVSGLSGGLCSIGHKTRWGEDCYMASVQDYMASVQDYMALSTGLHGFSTGLHGFSTGLHGWTLRPLSFLSPSLSFSRDLNVCVCVYTRQCACVMFNSIHSTNACDLWYDTWLQYRTTWFSTGLHGWT